MAHLKGPEMMRAASVWRGCGALAWGLLFLALPVAAADSPSGAQDEIAQARSSLRELGLWLDRAEALQRVVKDPVFLEQRSWCWDIGPGGDAELEKRVGERQKTLGEKLNALQSASTELETALGSSQAGEDARTNARNAVLALVTELKALGTAQEALEREVLSPFQTTSARAGNVVSDGFALAEPVPSSEFPNSQRNQFRKAASATEAELKQRLMEAGRSETSAEHLARAVARVLEGAPGKMQACVDMRQRWQAALALGARRPDLAMQAATLDGRIRRAFQAEMVLGDVFASNSSGLPSLMTESTGVADRLGGTDALAISVISTLGVDGKTAGSQAVASVRLPFETPNARMTVGNWTPVGGAVSFLARVQVPLERTYPDTSGVFRQPQEGKPATRRYAFTLGWDFSDQTDPRHLTPTRCLEALDALTPLPAVLSDKSVKEAVERRRPLQVQCAEQSMRDLRWGLRFSGQWRETELRGEQAGTVESAPSSLAIGIVAAQGHFTSQLAWRRGFEGKLIDPSAQHINSFVLAVHVGRNFGQSTLELERRVRLGLDLTATFRDRLGDKQPGGFEGLIAPSLLVRLGPDAFGTVAVGYLASPTRSGVVLNLGLTWDADRLLAEPLPAPAL